MRRRGSFIEEIVLFAIGLGILALGILWNSYGFPAGEIRGGNMTFSANTIVIGDETHLYVDKTFRASGATFVFSASAITIRGSTMPLTGQYVPLNKDWDGTFTVDGVTYTYFGGKTALVAYARLYIGPGPDALYVSTWETPFALASGPYLVFFNKPITKIVQKNSTVETIIIAKIKNKLFFAPVYSSSGTIFVYGAGHGVNFKGITITPSQKYVVINGETFTVIGTYSKVLLG